MGVKESLLDFWESIFGRWDQFLGLSRFLAFGYRLWVPYSRFEPHGVHFGPLEVDFRHLVVDVGNLGFDFKLLEVDFSSGGEFRLFLASGICFIGLW